MSEFGINSIHVINFSTVATKNIQGSSPQFFVPPESPTIFCALLLCPEKFVLNNIPTPFSRFALK